MQHESAQAAHEVGEDRAERHPGARRGLERLEVELAQRR
jgi:hypothetical protein